MYSSFLMLNILNHRIDSTSTLILLKKLASQTILHFCSDDRLSHLILIFPCVFSHLFQVRAVTRQQSSVGMRHRDHAVTGSVLKSINTALTSYFFGPNLDEKLTIDRFLDFQQQLERDILWLEVRYCVCE